MGNGARTAQPASGRHLPNFFIIGANRAGTTSLHHYLRQHPDIFLPSHKEPTFFALQQLAGRRLPETTPFGAGLIYEWADYTRLFEDSGGAKALGEVSTAYLTSAHAPIALRQHAPRARIIAVLRHPVDRAYSQYLMYRREGLEPIDDFEAALEAEPRRKVEGWPDGYQYTELSRYGAGLARYHDVFPGYRIKVYRYEQLRDDAVALLDDLFRFLDVDPSAAINTNERLNASPTPARPSEDIRRARIAAFREDLRQLDRLTGGDFSQWLDE